MWINTRTSRKTVCLMLFIVHVNVLQSVYIVYAAIITKLININFNYGVPDESQKTLKLPLQCHSYLVF